MTKPNAIQQTIALSDGRSITIETGLLAKQAHGAVVVSMGKAKLLATVVSSKTPKEGIDFLPLTLDYRERFPAAGRFPGGYLKREARPTDNEILVMRLVDRVLRPLFPPHYHHETQIMIQLMSHDPEVASDALAGLAASAALAVSDIPFDGPISEVRVARIDGEFVINPSHAALENADIDLMVGASIDSVTMVEGEMDEVSEDEMIEAIGVAHEAIKDQINAQIALAKEVGSYENKRDVVSVVVPDDIAQAVENFAKDKILDAALNLTQKEERSDRLSAIKEELMSTLDETTLAEDGKWYAMAYKALQKELIRELILDRDYRLDGRKPNEIRPIWSEIDYLPSVHGSSVFTRGETQALATVTLGTSSDANMIDEVSHTGEEYFYLHYNFPPFSTGEARPIRGVSRREIGHGNLAQRALKGAISPDNKYTIRLVSDILESNGSSSMATVCAGSMALMDAGVPMKSAVSGIAMGLVTDPATGRFTVLSDILGDEDFLGDMDFKVTGTDKGITACQMDIKIKGLSYEILSKALEQAREGRLHILNTILETIGSSRTDVKAYAPKLETVVVEKEFIGAIIGPGGKVIQDIQAKTGTTITINEVDDKGIVEVLGTSREGMDQALARIDSITFVPQVGDVYDAKVVSIQEYGAFVEIYPGTQGLLHISEIAWERVKNVEDVMKEGDTVKVKFTGLDPKSKKIRLSAKALLPRPEGVESRPRRDSNRD